MDDPGYTPGYTSPAGFLEPPYLSLK
jgi:hypothetical protein